MLTVLAVVVFVAALLVPDFGKFGLIPFGLLLAFSTGSAEAESERSVILTRRNLGVAAAMVAASGGSGCGIWIWPSRRPWRSPPC